MAFCSSLDCFVSVFYQNRPNNEAKTQIPDESADFFDRSDFKLARYLHHIRRAGRILL